MSDNMRGKKQFFANNAAVSWDYRHFFEADKVDESKESANSKLGIVSPHCIFICLKGRDDSSFFTRLSRDERNIIYPYLTLSPVRT
jgi:hypothetical protein